MLLGRQERQQEAAPLTRPQRGRQVDRPLAHTGTSTLVNQMSVAHHNTGPIRRCLTGYRTGTGTEFVERIRMRL